jgi:spore coat polysaccharide biosynthesis protein SpsF
MSKKVLKITGIIQARLDSKRLPGKVMKEVNGMPVLGYVIIRAKRIKGLDNIVLATTYRKSDETLIKYALKQNLYVHHGKVNDVTHRFISCAERFEADYLVRINADSPFIDPDLISKGIKYCYKNNPDLITNIIGRTFPYGISVEIISTVALKNSYKFMKKSEREHITSYLYNHSKDFNIITLTSSFKKIRKARMVIDEEPDFKIFKNVIKRLGNNALNMPYWKIAKVYLQEMDLL